MAAEGGASHVRDGDLVLTVASKVYNKSHEVGEADVRPGASPPTPCRYQHLVSGARARRPSSLPPLTPLPQPRAAAWLWSPGASVWRYELHAGHGCVPMAGQGEPTFKFAGGVLRASNSSLQS